MKYIVFIAALLISTPGFSKAKTTTKIDNVTAAKTAISNYQFEKADSLLKEEIAALKKKRKKTADVEALQASFQQQRMFIHATERIIFIDSLVCSKDSVLQNIPISKDAGRLDTWASTYFTQDALGCTLFENELSNKRYFAMPEEKGNVLLYSSDKIGDSWGKAQRVAGLNEDKNQNYPFLLSDGITLYYAAEGPESMGGYDIFVTRNNGDEGVCLTPENIGFPFNSKANDYLYVVDEMNNIGWFVTDRNQPQDLVCIYVFIPNETRRIYNDEISDFQLGNYAKLHAITDTWESKEAVDQALERLELLRSGKSVTSIHANDFYFPINATTAYTNFSHFRSPEAKAKMTQWVNLDKNLKTDRQLLNQLRANYATANDAVRQQIAPTIHRVESTYYPQLQQLQNLAKEIRQLENSKL